MTGDAPPPLSRFELAAAELRGLGITVTRLPGEYRVNFRTSTAATARTVETLDQALELGRAMAAEAPAPPGPAHRKRGRRPLRMTPKAIRRRMIHDPGAQSPYARAGLEKGTRPRHRTEFPKRHVPMPESTFAIFSDHWDFIAHYNAPESAR
jgi:hypothetical protein